MGRYAEASCPTVTSACRNRCLNTGSLQNTASLRKYKQMIDAWGPGGWGLFQDLLTTLRTVADKHDASIANVAVRYVLDRPAVGGVNAAKPAPGRFYGSYPISIPGS